MKHNPSNALAFTIKIWLTTVLLATALTVISLEVWDIVVKHKPFGFDPLIVEVTLVILAVATIFSIIPALLLSLVVGQIISNVKDPRFQKWLVLAASIAFIGLSYAAFLFLFVGMGRDISVENTVSYIGSFMIASVGSVITSITFSIWFYKIEPVAKKKNDHPISIYS